MAHDLACNELVELVTDYLEGALPPPERSRFELHLSACEACGHYLEQMKLTIRTLGRLSEDTIEPQARDELLSLFRDWKTGSVDR
jgi:anti-sigma factor RsiW